MFPEAPATSVADFPRRSGNGPTPERRSDLSSDRRFAARFQTADDLAMLARRVLAKATLLLIVTACTSHPASTTAPSSSAPGQGQPYALFSPPSCGDPSVTATLGTNGVDSDTTFYIAVNNEPVDGSPIVVPPGQTEAFGPFPIVDRDYITATADFDALKAVVISTTHVGLECNRTPPPS
jgi:hypothetical protein